MKKALSVVMAGLLLIVLVAVIYAAECETVTIDGIKAKKEAVVFAHKKHADKYECKDCHHTWDGNGDPKKCTDCHKVKKTEDTPKGFTAFHTKKSTVSCVGCHKKVGEGAGPVKCAGCHPKKKKK